MKIKFLGTAAAEGIPSPFCECNTCISARKLKNKNIRKRSSILINSDMIIDCGPDFINSCTQHNLTMSNLKYLLVTHAHFDHWYPENIEIRHKRYTKKEINNLNIIGNSSVFYKLNTLGYTDAELKINKINAIAYEKYKMGKYTVQPILSNHAHELGYALNYIVSDGKTKLLYATDTGIYSDEMIYKIKNEKIDVVIIDSTNLLANTSKNHLNMDGIKKMSSKMLRTSVIKTSSYFICTHFSHTAIPETYECLKAIGKQNDLIVAYDGLEMEI